MEIQLLDLTQEQARESYDALVRSCSFAAVQQTRHWAALSNAVGGYEPTFIVARDASGRAIAGLPLHLVAREGTSLLVSVPLPGAIGALVLADDLDPADARRAAVLLLDAAVVLGRQHGCASVSVVENPLANGGIRHEPANRPDYIWNTYLQASDLTALVAPDGEIDTGLGSKRNSAIRTALRRAGDAGMCVTEGDVGDLSAWYPIYASRMCAIGVRPVESTLFRDVLCMLGPSRASLFVVRTHGKMVGGLITLIQGSLGDVYALAASDSGMKDGAVYALCVTAMRSLQAKGARLLSWESSPGRDSGVYRFKQHWGAREVKYRVLTWRTGDIEQADGLTDLFPYHFIIPWEAVSGGHTTGEYFKS
jgi:hypothetical protein